MQKHLKYLLSAQLVFSSLGYTNIYSVDEDYEDELTQENEKEYLSENEESFNEQDDEYFDSAQVNYISLSDQNSPNDDMSPKGKTCHYSFFGEMLYLKPYFQGMPAIETGDLSQYPSLASGSTSRVAKAELSTFDLDFDFGFRIGFGFKAHWMGVENELSWMRFHTTTNYTYPPGNATSNTRVPYWNRSFSEACGFGYLFNDSAKIDWDVIDLTSKIPVTFFKHLVFSPKLGLRGLLSQMNITIQDQKAARGCGGPTELTPPLNTQMNQLSQKYNSIGILGGFDADVDLGLGFHFDTLFDGALTFGEIHTQNIGSRANVGGSSGVFTSKDSFYTFLPMIDLKLTVGWKKECFRSKVGFDIYAGYEVHYMPYFMQMIHLSDSQNQIEAYGFSMQGLNVGMGISF